MTEGLSVGRIQAGFAQAAQELTIAAANLNFDFSLVKLEAPSEYQAIGNFLTPSRVRAAETGPLHATARRLGALFEGVCPEAPNLIKAYGTRASEISREMSEVDSDGGSGQNRNWIRTEYGGIDATSIWAAATSSKAALPMHLLACIIARMWSHTEATSIWVEVVAERKVEIKSRFEEVGDVPVAWVSAIQQDITREQLSKWDASARAWLQTADKARQRQYKQFLLIIKNLSIAIHQDGTSLYSNVIYVWKSALDAMEGLVSGTPYVVRDGSVLLGLSAWHIFPDMVVFNSPMGNTEVSLNDALVKQGGILSLGISDPSRREEQGVYWSLSLAHHKFYGDPMRQTRRLDVNGSRLSMDELILICFGSLMRCWSIPKQGMNTSIKIIQELANAFPLGDQGKFEEDWQALIRRPLQMYMEESKEAILAVSLGRRRPNFLPSSLTAQRMPMFGFLDLPNLLFLLKEPDRKIELLRRLAARTAGLDNSNSIIVCFQDGSSRINHSFASVFSHSGENVDFPGHASHNSKFRRWIETPDHITEAYNDEIMAANNAKDRKLEAGGESPTAARLENEQLRVSHEKQIRNADGCLNLFHCREYDSDETEIQFSIYDNSQDSSGSGQDTYVNASEMHLNKCVSPQGGESEVNDNLNNGIAEGSSFEQDSSKQDGYEDNEDDGNGNGDGYCDDDKDEPEPPLIHHEDAWAANFNEPSNTWVPPMLPEDAKRVAEEAAKDRRMAIEEEMQKRIDSAKTKFSQARADHLNQRQRELRGESLVYLEDASGLYRRTFLPWDYDGLTDIVTVNNNPEDKYGFFFGQESDSKSLQYYAFGEQAAVYAKGKGRASAQSTPLGAGSAPTVTLDDILWCFEYDLIDPLRLKMMVEGEPAFAFLKVLVAVRELYREPAAGGGMISCSIVENTFDPPIFSKKLSKDDWFHAPSYVSIDQATAIALIGYFETGYNVIDGMKGNYNIIGLSGGDSIFVLTAMVKDPESDYPDYSFTRILGNTGRAGFSILTSPSDLMVRKLDPGAWRVQPADFNGTPQDSFKSTSLHLGFTDWQAPVVRFQSIGQRDADVNIIEAVVSVRDSGKWVADVNIHQALLSNRVRRHSHTCSHEKVALESSDILSIETWDQVLDCADGSVVVRCHDNWVARLAIVSVLCQHGSDVDRPIVICSKNSCSECNGINSPEGRDITYIY